MFIFHNIWDVILPIDFHIFQRGRSTTNQMMFSGWWMGTAKIPRCSGLVMYRWSLEIPNWLVQEGRPRVVSLFVILSIFLTYQWNKPQIYLYNNILYWPMQVNTIFLCEILRCCWVNRPWRCSCHLIAALVLLDRQRENCGQRLVAWRRAGDRTENAWDHGDLMAYY